jgi:hypothetical protein
MMTTHKMNNFLQKRKVNQGNHFISKINKEKERNRYQHRPNGTEYSNKVISLKMDTLIFWIIWTGHLKY